MSSTTGDGQQRVKPEKWSLGVLNDTETDEVPGSVLLLSKVSNYNEPLGMQNTPARTSHSSLPSQRRPSVASAAGQKRRQSVDDVKYTKDGKFVLGSLGGFEPGPGHKVVRIPYAGGKPKVADVIAEGMSLRLAQRSDYSAYIQRNNNDVGALIRALEAQVSQGAGLR